MARHIAIVLLAFLLPPSMSGAEHYPSDYFDIPTVGYPVVTADMAAAIGQIDIPLDYPVLRSVAVVGADEISGEWLKLNNDYLVSILAIGIVVNVESEEQLSILQLYTDIPLMAVSGFAADGFGQIYPFVIDATAKRVRQ